MALFWLSDEAWAAGYLGYPARAEGRLPLVDCPTDYRPSTTVYNRFNR